MGSFAEENWISARAREEEIAGGHFIMVLGGSGNLQAAIPTLVRSETSLKSEHKGLIAILRKKYQLQSLQQIAQTCCINFASSYIDPENAIQK